MKNLVAFLTQDGTDSRGRGFGDVIALDDTALERFHDFIQWLFPLTEPSRAVPDAPVLDNASLALLRGSATARDRQRHAADRMLTFYARTGHWRAPFDHNHLRITRIIRSLRLIAGDDAANDFKAKILELASDAPVNPDTRRFWDAA
jgi:hypothetical protein